MTYEEALAVATANNEIDENQTFLIDKNLRTVTIPDGFVLGVFNDKNVQIVPFAMPRYYNGIDMSTFAIQVNYVNSAGNGDIYLVFDQDVQEDLILFNWVVDRTAFATSGKTGFVVCMKEDDEYGYVAREFNTTLAYAPVLEGLEIDNPIDEQEVLDVLTQIRRAAERADIAAQQAEDSAAQASTDANTASDAASSATSSAATATAAQQSASASATSATNAETNALSYRNAAAASAAEAAAVVSGIEDVLSFPNALVVESATSEDIVTIEDGADDIPMQSVVAEITPVQNLNGQANPYPAGGGVNKFACGDAVGVTVKSACYDLDIDIDATAETIRIHGTPTWTSTGNRSFRVISTKAGSYWGDAPVTHDYSGFSGKWFVISKSSNISSIADAATMNSDGTIGITLTNTDTADVNIVLKLCIYEGSNAPTSWSPYSNICPISGRTGMTVTRAGKNLFPSKTLSMGGTNDRTVSINLPYTIPDGVYTMSFTVGGTGTGGWGIDFYDGRTNKTGSLSADTGVVILSAPTNRIYAYMAQADYSAGYTRIIDNIQLERGTVVTAYTPYVAPTTYPINWQTEAGTVYGGTLDVVSGVLTVDRAIVDMGTLNYTYDSSGGRFYTSVSGKKNESSDSEMMLAISSMYKPMTATAFQSNTTNGTMRGATIGGYCYFRNNEYTDAASFKTAMAGQTLCYKLATPQTYQLTPTEVRTILGVNNLWSDGDSMEVKYRADLKLYIDKKIAEAIA